jgi:hypothetical protein
MDDGPPASARAVIIATGATYRKPDIENLSRFEGAGVYYGATPMEARLCVNEDVVVVGGGDAAGQAAGFWGKPLAPVGASSGRDGGACALGNRKSSCCDAGARFFALRSASGRQYAVRRAGRVADLWISGDIRVNGRCLCHYARAP